MSTEEEMLIKGGSAVGPVKEWANCASFIEMGNVLYVDIKAGLTIREGQLFEAKTVKGGKNLIVAMRNVDGWMIYTHGDKVRKVQMETFVRAVYNGDLEPKHPKEIDTERLSMVQIGIDAFSNRRTAEEHIQIMGEGAEARYLQHTS